MDWNRLFMGKDPVDLFEARKLIKGLRISLYIWLLVALLMLPATLQQKAEVVSCWDELEDYRAVNASDVWFNNTQQVNDYRYNLIVGVKYNSSNSEA